MLHLILATILKSFYENREEEISKENKKKATSNRVFIYEKIVFDQEEQEEAKEKDDLFSNLSDDEPIKNHLFEQKKNLKSSDLSLNNSRGNVLVPTDQNKDGHLNSGSSRAIKRFEDKLALKAKAFDGQSSSRSIAHDKKRRKSQQLSVNPLGPHKSADDETNIELIKELSELRKDFVANTQGTFQQVMLNYEGSKRGYTQKKKEEESEDFFNFKAFEQCYLILNIQSKTQKAIFTAVYWWPVMLLEHVMVLVNCGYLCSISSKMSRQHRITLFYLNAVLAGYLLVVSLLRLYLIRRAAKPIKREYFIFLDIAIGFVAAVELVAGSVINGELLPASFLVFMIVRVIFKAYSISLSTSLKELLAQVRKTMSEIFYFLIILFVIILLFAFLGMTLFGEGTLADSEFMQNRVLRSANFSSFGSALFTIFMVLTLENWVPTFFEYRQKFSDGFVTVYFICLTFIVAIVMFKFLLSLIINNFLETSQRMEKMKRFKETTQIKDLTVDDQIYSRPL